MLEKAPRTVARRPSSSADKKGSVFESDDEETPAKPKRRGASQFSDDEDESGSDDSGSSGIGSDTPEGDEYDDIDEDARAYMRTTAPREPGWAEIKAAKEKPRRGAFVRGGYDYGQHMKPTGVVPGAVFVSKDGSMRSAMAGEDSDSEDENAGISAATKSSGQGPQLLPAELFASKPTKEAKRADEHDKMFGLMEDVDPDIQRMLDSDDEDYEGDKALASGNQEGDEIDPDDLLEDDFVMKAIQPLEGEEGTFDAKAYLDQIYRTGIIPGEKDDDDDPFGDDLDDIDDFLSEVPDGMKKVQQQGKKGSKNSKTQRASSLDDIDDDIPMPRRSKKVSFKGEDDEEFEEDEEYDSDMFEEDDDEEGGNHTGIANIPGAAPFSAEEAARARHKFEVAMAEYEQSMEVEYDDPSARGPLDVNELTDILDDFIDDAVVLGLRTANSKKEKQYRAAKALTGAMNSDNEEDEEDDEDDEEDEEHSEDDQEEEEGDDEEDGDMPAHPTKKGAKSSGKGRNRSVSQTSASSRVMMTSGPDAVPVWLPDSDDEEMEAVEAEEAPQWDVESYVSTYTNTENHPRTIDASALHRRIMLGREGVPVGVLQHERKRAAKENRERRRAEDEAYLAASSKDKEKINQGVARPKNETPEERKARKEAQKNEKRITRETKRQLKDSFRQETVRQQRQNAGQSRATIVHL